MSVKYQMWELRISARPVARVYRSGVCYLRWGIKTVTTSTYRLMTRDVVACKINISATALWHWKVTAELLRYHRVLPVPSSAVWLGLVRKRTKDSFDALMGDRNSSSLTYLSKRAIV
jgi:hypothetical protein